MVTLFKNNANVMPLGWTVYSCKEITKESHETPVGHLQSIQTSTIVILHPGSTTMWLGRATDYLPHSIPHVIAWRKPAQCKDDIPDETLLTRPGIYHQDSETQRELALSVVEQAIWSRKTSRKQHVSANQVHRLFASIIVMVHSSIFHHSMFTKH